jgi:hypothetical protein
MTLADKAKLFGKEWQEMTKEQKDEFYAKACADEDASQIMGAQVTDCSVKPKIDAGMPHVATPMEALNYMDSDEQDQDQEEDENEQLELDIPQLPFLIPTLPPQLPSEIQLNPEDDISFPLINK